MLGRSDSVWYGDVTQSAKQHLRSDPPDVLLTTPKSLEAMLISTNPVMRAHLQKFQAVVVDEIHAFAGDDSGWHLLRVLERLNEICGRELQRIGLSATVGNPDSLLQWLVANSVKNGSWCNPQARTL
jgi:ATP-dependent helicase Lhr and Lhr-like helicase